MSFGSQTHRPIAQLKSANNIKITNLPLPTSGVEVAHALQNNVKHLLIKVQNKNNAQLQYAFIVNESGTNYITLEANCFKTFELIDLVGKTIYLQSDKDSTIVEIEELY